MSDGEPVRLVLTAEQRELINRVTGRHVDAIEINADDDRSDGGHLRFLWHRVKTPDGPRVRRLRDDDELPPEATT